MDLNNQTDMNGNVAVGTDRLNDHSIGHSIGMESRDSTTNNSGLTDSRRESAATPMLAQKESKAVSAVRYSIFFVLLVATVGVSLLVFFYSRGDEKEDFENEFVDYANKIIESYTSSIEAQLGALDSFGVAITSFAQKTNSSFPFVTVPNFSVRSASIRILSDAVFFALIMIVTDEKRTLWEKYALKNKDWIVEEDQAERFFRQLQDDKFLKGDTEYEYIEKEQTPFAKSIFNELPNRTRVDAPNGTGPYAPYWQVTPPDFSLMRNLNMNMFTHKFFKGTATRCYESQKAIFNIAKFPADAAKYATYLQNGQFRYDKVDFGGDPTTNILYPVFDGFGPNKTMTAFFIVNMYFRLYLLDVLPANAHGIDVVIENNLDQTLTYQINGPDATFIGSGDHHDTAYDHMRVTQGILEYLQEKAGPDTASYTVVDVDGESIRYTLNIYPSAATEEIFLSNEPVLGAIIVSLVFVFTSGVFLLYDCLVERRQVVVMNSAEQTGALVSSLFPKNVQQRLMEDAAPKQKTENKLLWHAIGEDKNVMTNNAEEVENELLKSKPIADLYPETTILFADLAGFTAWSSSRTPQDVFVLLETVYNAFDQIAKKRGVYKIETIGDCYVAVTGLPKPQQTHAVIMARFASECLHTFSDVTHDLSNTLGEETKNLQTRVGLHSGPVTAGVLRGQKSRFQLFGDSMNTASRMESNGVKGRIHVSQATADELKAKGKAHWITPREDKIVAKGKGEMQTYFVEIKTDRSSHLSGVSGHSSLDLNNGVLEEEQRQQQEPEAEQRELEESEPGPAPEPESTPVPELVCAPIPEPELEAEPEPER